MSAAELHTESLISDGTQAGEEPETEAVAEIESNEEIPSGELRTNQNTVDNARSQRLTMDEIEKLKKGSTSAGQDIITQLLESHTALDQKTAFSLAKYKLRKRKKYLRRFTVLPLDVSMLTTYMLDQKDPARIMELNDEMLGLIGCWANVHNGGHAFDPPGASASSYRGRWLVVDETGGLLVATMAERMGILYPDPDESCSKPTVADPEHSMSATNTTLTLLHANAQPNLSLLKYFNFDPSEPPSNHPLTTNLKTLSWLQLLCPSQDPIYNEPPANIPPAEFATWKSSRRTVHHRKRRRYERTRRVVDEARAGGFDGLVVATTTDPASVLRHAVPLLAGGAPVVVYAPSLGPLAALSDLYSTARRTAFLSFRREAGADAEPSVEDFPVDPSLLFSPTVQTSRVRAWQVLPGRTHPMMTSRGGAVGYIFHAIRGIRDVDRYVEAHGKVGKKRRKVQENNWDTQESNNNEMKAETVV